MKKSIIFVLVLIICLSLTSCNSTKMAYAREDYLKFKVQAMETAHNPAIKNAICVAVPASVLMLSAIGL